MKQKCMGKKIIYPVARYLLTGAACIMLLLGSGGSEVSAKVSTDDVHSVSKICTEAQRVLKDYALIGMNVSYHNTLQENLTDIDKNIKKLIRTSTLGEKMTAEILEIEKIWTAAKPRFQKKPFSKETMYELHEMLDEDFTVRCEKILDHMALDPGIKSYEHAVQLGRLGMESQRLIAIYLLKTWGIDDPHYEVVVQHTLDKTDQIYQQLMNTDETLVSKEIKKALKKSKQKFIVFAVLVKSTSGRFMPTKAAKMADELYKTMQHISNTKKTLAGNNTSYFIPVANEPTS